MSDPNHVYSVDTWTFALETLLDWLELDPINGVLKIKPSSSTLPMIYEIVVKVTDSNSASDPVGALTTNVLCLKEVKVLKLKDSLKRLSQTLSSSLKKRHSLILKLK